MKPPAAAGAYCCAFSEYSTLVKFAPAVAASAKLSSSEIDLAKNDPSGRRAMQHGL